MIPKGRAFAASTAVLAAASLTACSAVRSIAEALGTSTVIFYTPIMHCYGVERPDGTVSTMFLTIYRIDSVDNAQPVDATISWLYFYNHPDLAGRYPNRIGTSLATFDAPVTLRPGERRTDLGLIAVLTRPQDERITFDRDEDGERINEREHYPPLQYDPTLRGELRPFVAINHGQRSGPHDGRPCTREGVLARAAAVR